MTAVYKGTKYKLLCHCHFVVESAFCARILCVIITTSLTMLNIKKNKLRNKGGCDRFKMFLENDYMLFLYLDLDDVIPESVCSS